MKKKVWIRLIALSCLVVTGSVNLALADPIPESWPVDRDLYPKAYGILANGPLMFPVDMSDWPVKVGETHQLFVDDYLLASTEAIEREVHQPTRHPGVRHRFQSRDIGFEIQDRSTRKGVDPIDLHHIVPHCTIRHRLRPRRLGRTGARVAKTPERGLWKSRRGCT